MYANEFSSPTSFNSQTLSRGILIAYLYDNKKMLKAADARDVYV